MNDLSRREFVLSAAAAATVGRWTGRQDPTDAYDAGLEKLVATGPEHGGGLSNHGPMAIDALVALDRPDVIGRWLDGYRKNLEAAPKPGRVLDADARTAALGKRDAFADFEATFTALLADQPWRDLVGEWQATLLPSLSAALAHGAIRTGHAVRALTAKDTPLRRQELARALAYQAANHRVTLGPTGTGTNDPLTTLPTVPLLPRELRKLSRGSSELRLAEAATHEPFTKAVANGGPGDSGPSAFRKSLLRTTARQFAHHGKEAPIFFLHAFTAVASLHSLWPCLDAATRTLACRHAWQLVAAIQARFGNRQFAAGAVVADAKEWPADLAAAAVAHGDEHVLKLTAACRIAWLDDPAPEFVAAARAAPELM